MLANRSDQGRHIFRWPDVLDRHLQEFLAGVAVVPDRCLVHGEDRKRPDPGQVESLGEKIRYRIAAEPAEIRRDEKADRHEPRASADGKQRGPLRALDERPGKPGKDDHGEESDRDCSAVEYRRHEPPGDVEVGDRPPERHGTRPRVKRGRDKDDKLDCERGSLPLIATLIPLPRMRYRASSVAATRNLDYHGSSHCLLSPFRFS